MIRRLSLTAVPRRTRPRGDAGISAPELLITMVVSLICLSLVVGFAITSTDAVHGTDLRTRSTQELTVALEHMTRMLRSTFRVQESDSPLLRDVDKIRTYGQTEKITPTHSGVETAFLSNIGSPNDPVLVHWFVDTDRNLVEELTHRDPGDTSWPDYNVSPIQRRVLLSNVVLPAVGQRAIFSWFGPRTSSVLNQNDPYLPLTRENVRQVVAVQINLSVRPATARAKITSMRAFTPLAEDIASLRVAPSWATPPSDDRDPPDGTCQNCGGMPLTRAYEESGGGGGGGSSVVGPVAGLA